jgi:hypothetical protein
MRELTDAEINGYVLRCMALYAVVFLVALAVFGL